MKLTNAVAVVVALARGGSAETKDQRLARMTAFWGHSDNQILYPAGKVLALVAVPADRKKGTSARTIADLLVAGESVELDTIQIDGVTLPLADGFSFSLANCFSSWGCPACRSAHGSGIAPSREASAKLLMDNKFFYRPSDKTLFTISATCWGDWCQALGAVTGARFCSPSSIKAHANNGKPKATTGKPKATPVTPATVIPESAPTEAVPTVVPTEDELYAQALADLEAKQEVKA